MRDRLARDGIAAEVDVRPDARHGMLAVLRGDAAQCELARALLARFAIAHTVAPAA
jgi:hypothetical protein